MDLDLGQLRALDAAVRTGSLDAAARALHVTPSAVSQRLRALETATGRVLLVRSRPVRPTASGEVVLRLARQVEALAAEARGELASGAGAGDGDDGEGDGDAGGGPPVEVAVAVNADSLATWFLPAVAPLADRVVLDIRREDQEHTQALLRDGTVMAAVTSSAAPVPGCSVTRLGAMRYRAVAAADFARRWFPDGAGPAALARAPVVVFDRRDELQHRWLRRRARRPLHPPAHHVPSSADFRSAVVLGLGWGMLPDLQAGDLLAEGSLVEVDPRGAPVDVALHWQQWRLRSPALDRVAAAVGEAARHALA